MKIKFSKHAKERIKFRRLSKTRITQTIEKPDKVISSFRLRKLIQKRYGDKILEVVARAEGKKLVVITAYYLTDKNENKVRQKN